MWGLGNGRRVIVIVALFTVGAILVLQVIPRLGMLGQAHGLLPNPVQDKEAAVVSIQSEETQSTPAEELSLLPLTPTYSWVNVYSFGSSLDGKPIPVGAVVQAFDPQGTLVGRTLVKSSGRYGLMPLYMDDPTTDQDEGARPGDRVTFTINGVPASVKGPHEPVWTANGDLLELDLVATSGPPGGWRGVLAQVEDWTIGEIRRLFD